MRNTFDTFAARRPTAARWILTAAKLTAMTLPAATIAAIIAGNRALALISAFASILLYPAGYHAAAIRYARRTRAEVADARRDALTGLPTRAAADERLDAATRDATAMTVALADVDGLHAINANLGHAAGDQYLTVVAQRLAQAVPAGGVLVRQGGDEFTLLAPNLDPDTLATRVGAAMAGPTVIGGYRFQPRASIGIASSGGGDARYARACADAAMYTAKAAGGNHTMVYHPGRDGRPAPDGTRPLLRRRDRNPLSTDGVAWLPTPGDDLLAVLWSLPQARTVHEALCATRDQWVQAAADARAASDLPQQPRPALSDRTTVEPTPAGYRNLARIADANAAGCARLADRLASIIDAVDRHVGRNDAVVR